MRMRLQTAARKTSPPAAQRSSPDAGMGWSHCLNRKNNEASQFTYKITPDLLDKIKSFKKKY